RCRLDTGDRDHRAPDRGDRSHAGPAPFREILKMADVQLDSIRMSFGQVEVLHGVSIAIASGEFVSLLGAAGCGKTTLLRIVAGLEGVTAGIVTIDGRDVTAFPPEKREIAMMFQSYALLPHLSV